MLHAAGGSTYSHTTAEEPVLLHELQILPSKQTDCSAQASMDTSICLYTGSSAYVAQMCVLQLTLTSSESIPQSGVNSLHFCTPSCAVHTYVACLVKHLEFCAACCAVSARSNRRTCHDIHDSGQTAPDEAPKTRRLWSTDPTYNFVAGLFHVQDKTEC